MSWRKNEVRTWKIKKRWETSPTPRLLSADGCALLQWNQRCEDTLKTQGRGASGKNRSSWPTASHAEGPSLPDVLQITPRGTATAC